VVGAGQTQFVESVDNRCPPGLISNSPFDALFVAVVLRVWRHSCDAADAIVSTWGVNLSGLVYLGNKIAEIQPAFFTPNTVIFNIRGGFFTSRQVVTEESGKSPPFVDNLNVKAVDGCKQVFRRTAVRAPKAEVRSSYNINKLRKLHSLQVTIRNKRLDVQVVREKIEVKCGLNNSDEANSPESPRASSPSNVRYAPQLLTMKSVNKMLEVRHNLIFISNVRTGGTSQKRD
jgi:hypothetical protein